MKLLNRPIVELMSKNTLTLHPKDKIQRAVEIFDELSIHHIPIVVMNKVVGIVSEGDILFAKKSFISNSFQDFLREQKMSIDAIEEVMTSPVTCIDQSSTLNDALDIMLVRRINALPVLKDNELVGLLTTHDILKSLKKES